MAGKSTYLRTVNNVRNLVWLNDAHTAFDCEVDFDELDENYVPFTATATDVEAHGRAIFADGVGGAYGAITEFDSVAWDAAQASRDADIAARKAKKETARNKLKAGTPLNDEDLTVLGLSDDTIDPGPEA